MLEKLDIQNKITILMIVLYYNLMQMEFEKNLTSTLEKIKEKIENETNRTLIIALEDEVEILKNIEKKYYIIKEGLENLNHDLENLAKEQIRHIQEILNEKLKTIQKNIENMTT